MSNMHEHLKAYIDGELAPQQAREVEQALQQDPKLRQHFDELRRISSTLREANAPVAVKGLDRTLRALQTAKPARRSLWRYAPAAGVVFACAAAFVMMIHYGSSRADYNDGLPMPISKSRVSGEASVAQAASSTGAAAPRATATSTPESSAFLDEGSRTSANGAASQVTGRALQRDVVKTGSLTLAVASTKQTMDAIEGIAKNFGGVVQRTQMSNEQNVSMSGGLSLRVPAAHFDDALAAIEKLGRVTGLSTALADGMAGVNQDLNKDSTMMAKTPSVRDRSPKEGFAGKRQAEAEDLEHRMRTPGREMGAITVTIRQEPPRALAKGTVENDDWLDHTWATAFNGLSVSGKIIVQGLIYLVVFCPLWIPFVLFAKLFRRHLRHAA